MTRFSIYKNKLRYQFKTCHGNKFSFFGWKVEDNKTAEVEVDRKPSLHKPELIRYVSQSYCVWAMGTLNTKPGTKGTIASVIYYNES